MNTEKLQDAVGLIGDDLICAVDALRPRGGARKKPREIPRRLGAIAACLCVVALAAVVLPRLDPPSGDSTGTSGMAGSDSGADSGAASGGDANSGAVSEGGAPCAVADGVTYIISSHPSSYDELPEGFAYAGRVDDGGEFDGAEYFRNPDIPEHIYLYIETASDGTVDPETGTLTRTEPHLAYVRFAHAAVRGKDLVSYKGQLYISMWHVGLNERVPEELYGAVKEEYSVRLEGAPPEGFVSVGTAEFSGYDIIPEGALASNEGAVEVFASPDDVRVVLVPAFWHTATAEEGRETRHEGYNVYIKYDFDREELK